MDTSTGRVAGDIIIRTFACVIVAFALIFVFNNYLIHWMQWPGALTFLQHKQWFGSGPLERALVGVEATLGWLQFLSYAGAVAYAAAYVLLTPKRPLGTDAEHLSTISAYLVRTVFWLTLLAGLIEISVALLQAGEWLDAVVRTGNGLEPGWSVRTLYVRIPILTASLILAWYVRLTGFTWLALLILLVEFELIMLRQIHYFDMPPIEVLVRSWYAALVMLVAAHCLVHGGGVDDTLFKASSDERGKAWANVILSLAFGLPICATVLLAGMWRQDSSINGFLSGVVDAPGDAGGGPGFLFAIFLVVIAVSMMIRLMGCFLYNAAILRGEAAVDTTLSRGGGLEESRKE